jgi:hypothetical protein
MSDFPVDNLTRATLRFAEFGFFGVAMNIWEQTPFRWGLTRSRGDLDFSIFCGFFRRIA